ncbi:MAG: hypothetical protein IPH11_15580 [Ignavibacteriales bacterium]|nr:hypothetical protein [Ignavibacteriales bacterium]
MKNIFQSLFILSLLFLFSCDGSDIPKNDSKVVCVLFDLSETTNTPAIRKNYLEKFKLILNSMNSGDAIEAALITEKSLSELDLSINCDFTKIIPFTDTDLAERIAKIQSDSIITLRKDSILAVADSILFKPNRKISKTEIIGSLQVAERVFKSFKQPRKILVVFSDMIEDSKDYNFEREILNSNRIRKIIDLEKQKHSLPDFNQVKVFVAGATHEDSRKYNQIKYFWFEYFKSCNANLEPQNYGAALINFNE